MDREEAKRLDALPCPACVAGAHVACSWHTARTYAIGRAAVLAENAAQVEARRAAILPFSYTVAANGTITTDRVSLLNMIANAKRS